MESSPLELYESAYRLHYVEQKLSEACRLYEAIIRQFPDSSECGYAAIQLQKIGAHDVAKSVRAQARKSGWLFPLLAVINLGALAVAAVWTQRAIQESSIRLQVLSIASTALGKAIAGEEESALSLLQKAKQLMPTSVDPYAIAAGVHEQSGNYDKALGEYEEFRRKNPSLPIPQEDIARLAMKAEAAKTRPSQPISIEPAIPAEIRSPQQIEAKLSGSKSALPAARKKTGGKSTLLVPRDSISFF